MDALTMQKVQVRGLELLFLFYPALGCKRHTLPHHGVHRTFVLTLRLEIPFSLDIVVLLELCSRTLGCLSPSFVSGRPSHDASWSRSSVCRSLSRSLSVRDGWCSLIASLGGYNVSRTRYNRYNTPRFQF